MTDMAPAPSSVNPPDRTVERAPTDAKRLRSFTTFFKNYMSVSAVLAAAAPIPVALFDLIPQYDSLRRLTTTMSSLLAFLTLAYIFFNRAVLGRIWFGTYLLRSSSASRKAPLHRWVTLAPVLLALLSIGSLVFYLVELERRLRGSESVNDVLDNVPFGHISNAALLIFPLIAFFVLAEAAFIVMALREYTQDLLGITDQELILNGVRESDRRSPIVRNAARLVARGDAKVVARDGVFVTVHDFHTDYKYSLDRREFEAALAEEESVAPPQEGIEATAPASAIGLGADDTIAAS